MTVQDTAVDAYDALGRPVAQRQRFKTTGAWAAPYTVGRTYTLAGSVKTQTYPSGRSVTYAYDAAGRLSRFNGTLGDGAQRTYSTGAAYDASGRMTREQFGTGTPLYNKRFYNVAGQLTQVRVGTYHATDQGWWNRGAIINHYTGQQWAGDGSDNNGNLLAQDIYVPNNDQLSGYWVATQRYEYDSLNRLSKVTEAEGGSDRWAQAYSYDRWGNRTVDAVGTWDTYPPEWSWHAPEFDDEDFQNTNRLHAKDDMNLPEAQRKMRYDKAGNLTQDVCHDKTTLCTRGYDAEGRMISAQVLNGQVQTLSYAYDADGRRVKRGTLSGEVWQVYGMDGELLADYAPGVSSSSPQKEYGYRGGELVITLEARPRANVALASNGATATASSSIDANRPASAAINGDRRGVHWGSDPATGSGWHDLSNNQFPDWLQVDFAGSRTINEVSIFSVQDNVSSPSEPTEQMTFTLYGVTAFHLEYWTGSAWAQIPGTGVSGNNKVWRKVVFAPVTTTKIRVVVTGGLLGHSRIAEVEAWEAPAGGADVRWLVSDHLGTPRMVFDRTGSLAGVSRHDYLPFGEELPAGDTGRTPSRGYSQVDQVRQQFTGYERDVETELDYAQARYYSPSQGRFTRVDDFFRDSQVGTPQSWNKYAYARNNPLKFVDPDGEKAHVQVTIDEETKRGTTHIKASFAVYAAEGSQISAKKMADYAARLKKQITEAWGNNSRGPAAFERLGIKYDVKVEIKAEVYKSEAAAEAAGAEGKVDNIVGVVDAGHLRYPADGSPVGGYVGRVEGEKFDRALIATYDADHNRGVFAHEFVHFLGTPDAYITGTLSHHKDRGSGRATLTDYELSFGENMVHARRIGSYRKTNRAPAVPRHWFK